MSTSEEWRPAPEWEGSYEVSDIGRVKSVARVTERSDGSTYTVRERILKTHLNKAGYACVTLRSFPRQITYLVHRLMLRAFVGAPPTKDHEGCHNDGLPSNNRIGNLRWGTRKSNQADRLLHGTSNRGERHPLAKLSEADVHEIRRRLKSGERGCVIAKDFGVTRKNISLIKRGKSWAWLK